MTALRSQHGLSLPVAIFVVVLLSLAGAMMLNLSGVQRQTAALSHQSARAYAAARAGVEWGAKSAIDAGSCPPPATLSLSEGGLRGFSVQVTCTSSQHRETGATFSVFSLDSVATYGALGNRDYVRRRLRVGITNAS